MQKLILFIIVTTATLYAKPYYKVKDYQPSAMDTKIYNECEYILDRYGKEDKETYKYMYQKAQHVYNTFEANELKPRGGFSKIHHILQEGCKNVKTRTSSINGRYSEITLMEYFLYYYDSRR
jgi:hypothetical protein